MCPNGSSRAPNFDVVRRTPLATARTRPCRLVNSVTIRSDSPSFCPRSTTASSRYSFVRNPVTDRTLRKGARRGDPLATRATDVGDQVEVEVVVHDGRAVLSG